VDEKDVEVVEALVISRPVHVRSKLRAPAARTY
jgi:hypothetical protein